VARQAIDRDHPDPVVDFVESAVCSTLEEVRTQRADLAQRLGVIEDEEVVLGVRRVQATQIQSPKSGHYRAQRRRIEPRAHQDLTERIDVVGDWTPAHERRLERRGAATGKRIIDGVARGGQALDEEPRQLGLEHRTIADLVQAVRLALRGRPELVHEIA